VINFLFQAKLISVAAFILYDGQVLTIAIFLFLSSLILQGVVSYITIPESDICVIRIRRVPHRYAQSVSVDLV
jgi:hypothetical protein